MTSDTPILEVECNHDGCTKTASPHELLKHQRDNHNLEQATLRNTSLDYCAHCGSDDVVAQKGQNTDDICMTCFNCGKYIWIAV